MAQQDKTDWYWNGVLAGAVNNLYYDFINVDVVHTPYATHNRNSSFFLQTRRNYIPSFKWSQFATKSHMDWDVVDVKYLWNSTCSKQEGNAYVLLANKGRSKIKIHSAAIKDGCVQEFDWNRVNGHEMAIEGCGALKLFVTNYVRGKMRDPGDIKDETGMGTPETVTDRYYGIQMNKLEGGTTHGYFSDVNVENATEKFIARGEDEEHPERGYAVGDYILVYKSRGEEGDGFEGQVRMITGMENGRLTVDEPWQGFKTPEGSEEWVKGGGLQYAIFPEWGEVVGFTQGRRIFIVNDANASSNWKQEVYNRDGLAYTTILSIADANDKIYILTDNGYIHYSTEAGYDKFFFNDTTQYVGTDKSSIVSYRDMIIAFGDRKIAVGVPDTNNERLNTYNQSSTVGVWSRYAYAEYDGDLIFVSNDKRLLALGIANNAGKYMLQYEDVGDMINGKLSTLTIGDEIYIGNDNNDLRVFVQTKSKPYYNAHGDFRAHLTKDAEDKYEQENTMTRIIKFDTLFKVWTEDWVQGILLQGVEGGIYYGENGLYQRAVGGADVKGDNWSKNYDGAVEGHSYPFKTYISAYLIENESDWVGGTNSWLANRPKLYNLSKLNRLITILGPGEYTDESKIRITSYIKGFGTVYEFNVNGDNNDWLGLITSKYLGEAFDGDEKKRIECLTSVLQDNKKSYQAKCIGTPNAAIQNLAQQQPWCDNYDELQTLDKGICIDDSLYEFAPTMPLVTRLGENQSYATQIKLELIGGVGDRISFGGWLGEMFVAPLFTVGPDGEYQLQPNTDC